MCALSLRTTSLRQLLCWHRLNLDIPRFQTSISAPTLALYPGCLLDRRGFSSRYVLSFSHSSLFLYYFNNCCTFLEERSRHRFNCQFEIYVNCSFGSRIFSIFVTTPCPHTWFTITVTTSNRLFSWHRHFCSSFWIGDDSNPGMFSIALLFLKYSFSLFLDLSKNFHSLVEERNRHRSYSEVGIDVNQLICRLWILVLRGTLVPRNSS